MPACVCCTNADTAATHAPLLHMHAACNVIAVGCVLFVIIAGFTQADVNNLSPFLGDFG